MLFGMLCVAVGENKCSKMPPQCREPWRSVIRCSTGVNFSSGGGGPDNLVADVGFVVVPKPPQRITQIELSCD